MPEILRKSLASTNIIESAFSVVAEDLCRRVEALAGRRSSRALGGIGAPSGREQISRVKGYKEIPNHLTALADHGMKAIMKKDLPQRRKLHNFMGVKVAVHNVGRAPNVVESLPLL